MFDMKKQLRWAKLKVGLVITLALLVLLVALFFAGGIEKIFSPKVDLKIQFQDVRGLRKGAPVWIFGTEVGSVRKIDLDQTSGALVTISLKKDVLGFIKKDAKATIMTMGLLGDKYVELNTGSPKSEPIQRGEVIRGSLPVEISEVMETAGVSIAKIGDFIEKLDNLILKIEQGEGTLAKFLTDPSIYDNLNRSAKTLSLTLEEVRGSKGTLKMLVDDPSLYQKMVSAISSIEEFAKKTNESVSEITRKVNESQGTLKKLLEDPSLYDKALATVSSIDQFSKKLHDQTGTLKKLIEDPQLYENLNEGAGRLSSILKRIDQGEGVAGSLVREKALIKELEETIHEFRGAAGELRELIKDMKANPKKYLKFSIF
ncbi:MAG: MCE family protein [Deltaproteobacteria bacterium]|nr:MCE family protein [Deltaproteobacteria bacterium]